VLLPSSDDAWGGALASTWMTGFAPRTGFGRGMPEFDPWRFDVSRMIAVGEADLHVVMSARREASARAHGKPKTIALACTDAALPRAAVTIAIGEPGTDHDGVRYSSRTGTLISVAAKEPSALPSAASVMRMIAEALRC
jgi:formylmethanofuran dehydrogenase subunit B